MVTRIAKTIRHLTADDLRSYLVFRRIDLDDMVDWQKPKAKLACQIISLINDLPITQRTSVLLDTERIDELADEAGFRAMHDVVHDRKALLEAFGRIDGHHSRELWLFMHDVEAFNQAGMIKTAERQRGGRSWSGFIGPAGKELDRSEAALTGLKQACAEAYRDSGGLNGQVEVEVFERLASWRDDDDYGSVSQTTLYVEDRPQSLMQFEDDGLHRQVTRPANEVHVVYCATDGSIDVMASGGNSIKKALACHFLHHALGVDMDPEAIRLREIDLSSLADEATLQRNTEWAVAKVDLRSARLKLLDRRFPSLTFEKPARSDQTVYDAAEHGLGARRLDTRGYWIDRVELAFQFLPELGHARGDRVTVTLTCPNGCSVKDKSHRHRPAIEMFLEKTGIYRPIDMGSDGQTDAAA